MCKSKRDGGKRCSAHMRAALVKALKSGDAARIAEAQHNYNMTPAGIAALAKSGEQRLANEYTELAQEENQRCDERKEFYINEADKDGYDADGYDFDGMSADGFEHYSDLDNLNEMVVGDYLRDNELTDKNGWERDSRQYGNHRSILQGDTETGDLCSSEFYVDSEGEFQDIEVRLIDFVNASGEERRVFLIPVSAEKIAENGGHPDGVLEAHDSLGQAERAARHGGWSLGSNTYEEAEESYHGSIYYDDSQDDKDFNMYWN